MTPAIRSIFGHSYRRHHEDTEIVERRLVMRGLDPRIHSTSKEPLEENGLPGRSPAMTMAFARSIALIQLLAALRHRIEKRRNLAVEKLDIGRIEAASGSMTGHGARRDRHHPDALYVR